MVNNMAIDLRVPLPEGKSYTNARFAIFLSKGAWRVGGRSNFTIEKIIEMVHKGREVPPTG